MNGRRIREALPAVIVLVAIGWCAFAALSGRR